MITKHFCEVCGEQFDDTKTCQIHEEGAHSITRACEHLTANGIAEAELYLRPLANDRVLLELRYGHGQRRVKTRFMIAGNVTPEGEAEYPGEPLLQLGHLSQSGGESDGEETEEAVKSPA